MTDDAWGWAFFIVLFALLFSTIIYAIWEFSMTGQRVI